MWPCNAPHSTRLRITLQSLLCGNILTALPCHVMPCQDTITRFPRQKRERGERPCRGAADGIAPKPFPDPVKHGLDTPPVVATGVEACSK
ncbi:hypothetical protein B0O80DRAFT_449492 [Mortierella sp. GBAus27b]|nr:hypothetical protein B0O80DRAFT_449492 [Mortierella sp. GBAus27b]